MYRISVRAKPCQPFLKHAIAMRHIGQSFMDSLTMALQNEPNPVTVTYEKHQAEMAKGTTLTIRSPEYFFEFGSLDDFTAFVLRWS